MFEMPPILTAANPNYQISTFHVYADTNVSSDDKTKPLKGIIASDPKTFERLQINLTPPPSPCFVTGVTRRLEFPQGSQPAVATVVEGLRKKYGPETANPDLVVFGMKPFKTGGGSFTTQIYRWTFDFQGQLIKWTKDNKMAMHNCGYGVGDGQVAEAQGNLIRSGLASQNINTSLCTGTRVDASLGVNAAGLVQSLTITMHNRMLYDSGMESTWKWVDHMSKQQLEKQRQQGETVAAPKL